MLCAANHPRPPHSAAPFMSSSSRPPRPRPPRRSENAAPTSLSFTAPIYLFLTATGKCRVGFPQECEDSPHPPPHPTHPTTNVSEYPLQLFNEVKLTNSFSLRCSSLRDVCLVPEYQPRRIVMHKEVNLPPSEPRSTEVLCVNLCH
ncbi:uncharacterized protein LOC110434923 isoform X1 [Sorghum bicolor]|uniref:uncharacterized protein LOC110434923 isoform X1 n=1 Tax=Sorghum bicolor TaxID=4558 RepID=UPI00081AD7D5|nr:uncharacterized protein LOC110434923 isoform X1 [Sorghum bicolor]|eukprot:XP_021315603.1 uncharacterized protein LOC110434923 isoform X1 [Sorghum bicolor]